MFSIAKKRMKKLTALAAIVSGCFIALVVLSAMAEVLPDEEKGSLVASTFLGGSSLGADGFEYIEAMASDSEGNIYLAGCTNSADFPVIGGSSYANYPSYDIFVAKMNSSLTVLLASTVIGGGQWDQAFDLNIGPDGSVYILGASNSSDYPVTDNAYDTTFNGNTTYVNAYYNSGPLPNYDTVITKLSPDLKTIQASSFLGGDNTNYNGEEYGGREYGYSLDFDSNGDVYVLGTTESVNFPTTDLTVKDETIFYGAFTRDIYISKLSADLQTLKNSTLLTGAGQESSAKIIVDANDTIYIAGNTTSLSLTANADVFANNRTPGSTSMYEYNKEGFIAILDTDLHVTDGAYLGGADSDTIHDMIIAADGDLLIGGSTQSSNYPITGGVYKQVCTGTADAFLTRMSGDLDTIDASTVVGGAKGENVSAIVENTAGNIIVAGSTQSIGYPVTPGAFSTFMVEKVENSSLNNQDVFVSKFSSDLTSLEASTFIGNSDKDQLNNMILSGNNLVLSGLAEASSNYLVGGVITNGTCNYPVTLGAYDTSFNGGRYDVFVSIMDQSLAAAEGTAAVPVWSDGAVITQSDLTTESVAVSWPEAANAVGYKVMVNGIAVGTTTSLLSYTISGLSAGASYEISIEAVNSDGVAVAISASLIVTTIATSVPQGIAVFVAMTSPLVYQTEVTATAYINQAVDTVNYDGDLVLTLIFSGTGTIKYVTTSNIIFYPKNTPDSLIPITLIPSGTLTSVTGYTVRVTVPAGSLVKDTEYVLQIKYDAALTTNIQGNNASKVIGKNVYYYLTTAGDGSSGDEPDEEAPYWDASDALTVSNQVGSSLQLNWPEAFDNVGVSSYLVYQNNTLLGSTDELFHQVNDLALGGSYTFQIIAVDASGNASATGLSLTVDMPKPPVADAGEHQTVKNGVVTLDGSNSEDPDGGIVSYAWRLQNRFFVNDTKEAEGVTSTVSGLKKGIYDVTLTVTDDDGLTDTDTMTVTSCFISTLR